jgi:hypothetical protein
LAATEELCEITLFDNQGLRSRSRESFAASQIPEFEPSEAARVNEAQFAAAGEG